MAAPAGHGAAQAHRSGPAASDPVADATRHTRGWCAAPSTVSVLLACGWLRLADTPGLRIDAMSSSHELSRVTAPDGRCVVVKQVPQQAAARRRNLTSEMFVYRLARWMPEIARVVPQPVFIDEGRHLLVVDALCTGACWPDPARRAAISSPEVCAQLGAALAEVHHATANMAMWQSPAAGILGLPMAVAEACVDRPPTTQALMRFIADDPELGPMLDAGAAAYTARCVIHGDLRQENWLIGDRATNDTLKLFDWELAGSGDPAWDLGSVVAEAVLDHIREHRAEAGANALPESIAVPCRALLRAYFGKRTVLDPAAGATWSKLALYAHARLLHVACECADQAVDRGEWPVTAIVSAARSIARRADEAAEQMQAWAGA